MLPLILSTVLSFLSVHSSVIGKQILRWVNKPTNKEKELFDEREHLKSEQNKLHMIDNFASYSKIQRKINAIDESLARFRNEKNSLTLQLGLVYGLKVILSIILVALSVYYRYSPVFELSSSLDLMPFGYMISYPNSNNQVSFHFWVLCSSSIARLIKI